MKVFYHRLCTFPVLCTCFFLLLGLIACEISNYLNIIDTWNNGSVELVFAKNGTFEQCNQHGCEIKGTYIISENEISLTDNNCGSAVGVYGLSFNEDLDELTFVLVSDLCEQRASTMPGTWDRASLLYPARE